MDCNIKINYYVGKKCAAHIFHPVYSDRCFPFAVILYVHSGSYLVWQNGKWRRYMPGEAFVIKSFVFHMVKIDEPSVISWVHLSWRTPGGMDVLSGVELPDVFINEYAYEIGKICGNIAEAASRGESLISSVLLQKDALSLLAFILSHPDVKYSGVTESARFKEDIIAYISEHIDSEISVCDMANAFHLSLSAFRRKFIKLLNTTPKAFIQQRRLERAFEYLSYDNMTISEVAAKSGYNDPGYFSRAFTSKFKMSPSKYREIFRESLKNN